jgi:ribosomal protein S25
MRTEFVQQKVILREKIFRKVKPKVLNGKFVTGEMLLELADAYT